MKHTATPWSYNKKSVVKRIFGPDNGNFGYRTGDYICELKDNDQANAALIVKAVNLHSELVETLEAAIKRIDLANKEGNTILAAWLPEAKALLAKAKEGRE